MNHTLRELSRKKAGGADFLTSNEVLRATRATPRQLQWWDEHYLIRPVHIAHQRFYSPTQCQIIGWVVQLRRFGLSPKRALKLIRAANLVACKFITSAMSPGTPEELARRPSIIPPSEPERSFGNYETGRFAWILEDVNRLETPIPAKGALGLWKWLEPKPAALDSE